MNCCRPEEVRRKQYISLVCVGCKKEYQVPPNMKNKRKYCSSECFGLNGPKSGGRNRSTKGIYRNCLVCGKQFYVYPTRLKTHKLCSRKCADDFQRTHTARERRKAAYSKNNKRLLGTSSQALRRFVFANKAIKCEVCGYNKHSFNIDVHHKDRNLENSSLENLIVLCVMCHRETHKGLINLDETLKNKQVQANA